MTRTPFATVIDEIVDGHVMQLVEIFTLNAEGEVGEISSPAYGS